MVGGSCQCPECGQFFLADFTLALVETPQQLTPPTPAQWLGTSKSNEQVASPAAGEPPAHGCMAPPPTLPQGFPGDAQWLGPVSTSEVVSKSASSKRQKPTGTQAWWWSRRNSSWYPSMEGAVASSSNSNSGRRRGERSRSKPRRTSGDRVPSTPQPRDSDSGNHPGWSRQCADLRPRFAQVPIRSLQECKEIVRSCHRGTNMRATKQKCTVCGHDTCHQYEALPVIVCKNCWEACRQEEPEVHQQWIAARENFDKYGWK
jgi:hypothetical protein